LFSNNMFRQCLNVVEAAPFWRSTPWGIMIDWWDGTDT
jgi:hypothetical protein